MTTEQLLRMQGRIDADLYQSWCDLEAAREIQRHLLSRHGVGATEPANDPAISRQVRELNERLEERLQRSLG